MFRIGQAHEEGEGAAVAGGGRPARGRTVAAVAILALAGALAACGPTTYRAALVQQGALSQAVMTLQQAEHDAYQGHVYDEARHQRYGQVIDQVEKNLPALNDAMTNWKRGQPAPKVVTDAIDGLRRIQNDQATVDPPSGSLLAAIQQTISLLMASEG